MKISIAGQGVTRFGELWDKSLEDLGKEAIEKAINNAHLEPKHINAVFVANMAAEQFDGQVHLGALFSSSLPHHPPALRVEGACASGGLAMLAAEDALLSGRYNTVLVLGVEKMTDHSNEVVTEVLSGAADREREMLSTFPGLYALVAQLHMQRYGTTPEQLAAVAVKNHHNAVLHNPLAQFHKEITANDVVNSLMVANPLHLLDCSPITDGAAAVILTTKKVRNAPIIIGRGHGQDSLTFADRKLLTGFEATRRAATQAYKEARVTAIDINLAELHDCFTIAEIVAYEDLGFCPEGKGGSFVEKLVDGANKKHMNHSGGLKACGHPVGATGVKQIAYLSSLLRQGVGHIALSHNVGGLGATSVIHILTDGRSQ